MKNLTVRREQGPDMLLLMAVSGLLVVGLIMVFSASQYIAGDSALNDSFYYLKKQAVWAIIGLVAMYFVVRFDYHLLAQMSVPLLIVAVVCLLLVKLGAGVASLGAERTLSLGPIHFQPSELAKLALVIFFAYNMTKESNQIKTFGKGFAFHVLVLGLLCGLIMLQPDLGTSVALVGTAFLMMLAGGVKPVYLIMMVIAGCALVALAIILEPFRMARFTAFLDPWADALGYGFQTVQSLIAIGSGGFSGVGLGEGTAKLYYLPEIHTDFIFSIIGEELGFVGSGFVVLLFGVLIWRGIRVAIFMEDAFGAMLALGITAMIGVQTLINFFVTTGMMPVTGIALPFISYGGTSLLFTMVGAGLLLNLSTYLPKGVK